MNLWVLNHRRETMKVTLYGKQCTFTVRNQTDISDNDILREVIGKEIGFENLKESADWCEREFMRGPLQYTSYSARELEEAEKVYDSIVSLVYANADILGGIDHVRVVIFLKNTLSTADKVVDAAEN